MTTFIFICLSCALIITVAYDQLNAEGSKLLYLTALADIALDKIGLIWLSKPLYACMVCMSSVWGGTTFALISRLFSPQYGLLEVVCAIPVIGGMMVIISCVIFMRDNQDNYEQNERL